MNSIKSELEAVNKKSINKISRPSLTVALIALVVFTIFPQSYLQATKPAPSYIISKTLNDDAAGHSHGWNPDGNTAENFIINDNQVTPTKFVHIISVEDPNTEVICGGDTLVLRQGQFKFSCNIEIPNGDPLHYIIINVPTQVITSLSASYSASESSPSSPFTTLQAGK